MMTTPDNPIHDQFSRTALLLGADNIRRLQASKVAVFGIGGVGGNCVEALVRAGVGGIAVFDNDRVCLSNINRQVIATHSTVGMYKVDAMKQRILDINPDCAVDVHPLFYGVDTADSIDLSAYDYIVDAVDNMTAKLELACRASATGVPLISAMGAANKLNPAAFEVADIYDTSMCPLARIMRRELRKRGIGALKVVYSREPAVPAANSRAESAEQSGSCAFEAVSSCNEAMTDTRRRVTPASVSFVPPVAGLVIAGEVVKDLIGWEAAE